MGYKREPPPKHPIGGNPVVTPLPVPYCPHFGSREPCHTCMENWMEIQTSSLRTTKTTKTPITPATTTTRGQTDLKHISGLTEEDCHQPNRGPEGSSSSSSRTRSGKESSSTSTPGIPQVRYDTHRSSEHVHRTRANTQRQQHAAV